MGIYDNEHLWELVEEKGKLELKKLKKDWELEIIELEIKKLNKEKEIGIITQKIVIKEEEIKQWKNKLFFDLSKENE